MCHATPQVKSPEQFRKIAALAVVFCLSVVLGNVALRFIPVSFSQVRQTNRGRGNSVHVPSQQYAWQLGAALVQPGAASMDSCTLRPHARTICAHSTPALASAVHCAVSVLGGPARQPFRICKLHAGALQAIGATTPVFTAVLAVAMMGKRESGIVYAALLPVVIGIVIATGAHDALHDSLCHHVTH